MSQEPSLMANRLQPICVHSRSSAVKSGAAEIQVEYGKNDSAASIDPRMTQIFAD
ncbi:hypothetical protein [Candidatus Thiosymbion oneisti]|uniref:hypothetical protein n=1 Tax=Candidatus Thiosymbion oneisti TaxID=589554 RepID=UPI001A9C68D6|nr:hypothetical protein [Candidatus Thiosymbion oneisti]